MAATTTALRTLCLALAYGVLVSGQGTSVHDSASHPGNYVSKVDVKLVRPVLQPPAAFRHEHPQTTSHGHHGEEEGEEEDYSSVVLVFTFMALTISFLFLAFYPDPDIRWIFYNMLSNVIAIFLAILMNATIFKFLTVWVVDSRIHVALRFVMFFSAIIALNAFASRCHSTKTLFMVSSMGEHLFAFSGIGAFFKIQELISAHSGLHYRWQAILMILVGASARFTCMLLFLMSAWMRKRLNSKHTKDAAATITSKCVEAENQGSITLVSFLYIQAVLVLLTGLFLPMEVSARAEIDIGERPLQIALAIFMVGCGAVVCHVCVGVLKHHICRGLNESWRHTNNFLELPGMSISWCFLRSSVLFAAVTFPRHKVASLTVNAAFMYGLAMLVVLVLDRVADAQATAIKEREAKSTLALAQGEKYSSDSDSEAGRGFKDALTEDFAHHIASNARSTIRYLSLLVGLCWEKAWDEADELTLEMNIVRRNPVLSQMILAVVMTLWTGTAWYHYIVRMAILTVDEHETRISNEKAEMDRFTFEPDEIEGSGSSEEE